MTPRERLQAIRDLTRVRLVSVRGPERWSAGEIERARRTAGTWDWYGDVIDDINAFEASR